MYEEKIYELKKADRVKQETQNIIDFRPQMLMVRYKSEIAQRIENSSQQGKFETSIEIPKQYFDKDLFETLKKHLIELGYSLTVRIPEEHPFVYGLGVSWK